MCIDIDIQNTYFSLVCVIDGHCPIIFVLICSCMSFLCLIVSIIFMRFFNKTLFILSSIILTGGGAV